MTRTQPNLLFLYTDEQRRDTLGAYGNSRIQTPHLNRLAREATVFESAYCTQPVCTPSRSSIVTGLYPHTTGCVNNNIPLAEDVPTIAELLDGSGYHCAHYGKWHLGDEIYAQHGFDEWKAADDTYYGHYSPGRDLSDRSPYHHWLIERGYTPAGMPNGQPAGRNRFTREQIARLPEEVSRPAYLAGEAQEFIRENQRRPWVLYLNFLEPHMPFYGPRDNQYDPSEVTLPGNFAHDIENDPRVPLRARVRAARWRTQGFEIDPQLADEEDWRGLTARYWGLASQVDTHVGRILRALEETGQMDNTIVVFTSDHGDLMSSHRLLGKGMMWEEASGVPLIVRLPGQRTARRIRGPVSQVDLVPTLLDVMGQGVPGSLQGTSRPDCLQGRADAVNEEVFIEWTSDRRPDHPVPDYARHLGEEQAIQQSEASQLRAVVTPDGWKASFSTAGEHELYNLSADPLEMDNLAATPAGREKLAELRPHIARWQERTRDELELPEVQ